MKQGRTDAMEMLLVYGNITDQILYLRIGVTEDIMADIERKVTIIREEI